MSTITIDIRIAQESDAPHIARVHHESWQASYQGLLPGRELALAIGRRGPKWWQRAIKRGLRILVVEFAGAVVGYATLGESRVKWSVPAGEVYELYLLPTHQGVGLGRKLLKAASNRLESLGYEALLIWCLEKNEPACAFYESVKGTPVAKAHEKFEGKPVLKTGYAWRLA